MNPIPALDSPLAMVSTSPVTLISSLEISIKLPLSATTSLPEGITVKSIDVSALTVEVKMKALIVISPVE